MRGGPLVVVGDTMLDVDLEGVTSRLAPDAPVPVVDCERERHRAGGAGLAAILGARLAGAEVVLITALGDDRPGERLRELLAPRVGVLPVPLRGGTPCKIRVRGSGQPLLRLDAGSGRALPGPLDPRIESALRSAGAVLVADYGRGMTAHPRLRAILHRLPRSVPVVWDPHPRGEQPVPGTRLVTPNRPEARGFAAALGRRPPASPEPAASPDSTAAPGPLAGAARDAAVLNHAWGAAVAVTLGPAGALLCVGEDVPFLAPAPGGPAAGPPLDSCGAGDCFAAAAAQVIRSGGLLTEAVEEAVRCASDFVRLGGARTVPGLTVPAEPDPVPAAADPGRSAWAVAADVRKRGGRVIATGGCFDLLHAGHVGLLRQARGLGDCLIVCINSDASVRALKGPGRPLVSAEDRARVLAALECVDGVLVFEEQTPSAVLDRLRPDVWVKGGDYARGELAEAAAVRRYGGEVVLLPYAARHSTSRIVAAARMLGDGPARAAAARSDRGAAG